MQTSDRRQPTAPDHASRWYVAETLPGREGVAIQNLRRQAFRGFCPRFRKLRKHARRQDVVLVPLFPGYVFIALDPEREPWRSINGTFGIRRLIGSDGSRPRPMPEAAMEQILARCADGADGIVTRLLDDPEPGRRVRIINGPFADSLASIESLDGRGRVRILLDILGGECPVSMNVDCLAPV